MSAMPALDYLFGLGLFGFLYWLLDGIKGYMVDISETGNVYDLIRYVWMGAVVIYLVFGAYWLPLKYREKEYQ